MPITDSFENMFIRLGQSNLANICNGGRGKKSSKNCYEKRNLRIYKKKKQKKRVSGQNLR